MTRRFRTLASLLLLTCLLAASCAKDVYQQRAEQVKDHTESFYRLLREGAVAGAVAENERIEGMASEMERGLVRRATSMDTNQKAREWSLIKTTNHTAIENWLNLGRYFAQTRRPDQAKGAYQRVIETYCEKGAEYEPLVERARLALKDAETILAPSPKP